MRNLLTRGWWPLLTAAAALAFVGVTLIAKVTAGGHVAWLGAAALAFIFAHEHVMIYRYCKATDKMIELLGEQCDNLARDLDRS